METAARGGVRCLHIESLQEWGLQCVRQETGLRRGSPSLYRRPPVPAKKFLVKLKVQPYVVCTGVR